MKLCIYFCFVVVLLLPVFGCQLNPALFNIDPPPLPPLAPLPVPVTPVSPEEYVTPPWVQQVGGLLGTAFLVIGHRYWYHRGRKRDK